MRALTKRLRPRGALRGSQEFTLPYLESWRLYTIQSAASDYKHPEVDMGYIRNMLGFFFRRSYLSTPGGL